MAEPERIRRRTFIKISVGAGGGLLVGVRLLGCSDADAPGGPPESAGAAGAPSGADTLELHAYVEISTAGAVTLTAPCPEIGQGVRTSLAQLVAEELDVEWTSVRVRQGEANSRYGGQAVGGSDSARDYWTPLRRAGAAAREALRRAAADEWGVPVEECVGTRGVVSHGRSGRSATYGALAAAAARVSPPAQTNLRDPADFLLIGTSPRGVDVDAVVSGTARYGMDVRVPGLLRAVVARSPIHGGRVAGYDEAAALAVPGVQRVVELAPTVPAGDLYAAVRGGVAVVAGDTWSAMRGRDALGVVWDEGRNVMESTDGIGERLRSAAASGTAQAIRDEGDVDAAFGSAARIVERSYELPMIAHACMEPMNSTAHATGDGCELWGPVQVPQRLREGVATALRLPRSAVRVYPTLGGGGFGRRLAVDYGVEAALLSRAVEAPVQVVWTREDDIRLDYFRPPSAHQLRAALDDAGAVIAWEHRIATPSLLSNIEAGAVSTNPAIYDVQGAADLPLATSNIRVSHTPVPVGLQMGSWRSVAHSFNSFAVSCFVAELAEETRRDPLEMTRVLLGAPRVEAITLPLPGRRGRPRPDVGRLLRVIEIAGERAGWGQALPPGWGRGIAWAEYKGSYAAHVADVEVLPTGAVAVRRVVAAMDCGRVINPSGTRAQVEGAVMDGVATVLHWGITVRAGRVVEGNLDEYGLVRIGEAPQVDAYLVESDMPPAGAGEPPYPSVAPAIANAIYDAGGARLRRLPIGA